MHTLGIYADTPLSDGGIMTPLDITVNYILCLQSRLSQPLVVYILAADITTKSPDAVLADSSGPHLVPDRPPAPAAHLPYADMALIDGSRVFGQGGYFPLHPPDYRLYRCRACWRGNTSSRCRGF